MLQLTTAVVACQVDRYPPTLNYSLFPMSSAVIGCGQFGVKACGWQRFPSAEFPLTRFKDFLLRERSRSDLDNKK
jgi:hypothetical protein